MGDDEPQPQPDPNQVCERCSGPLVELLHIARTAEHPAYRIIGCTACTFMKWIAEQIDDD